MSKGWSKSLAAEYHRRLGEMAERSVYVQLRLQEFALCDKYGLNRNQAVSFCNSARDAVHMYMTDTGAFAKADNQLGQRFGPTEVLRRTKTHIRKIELSAKKALALTRRKTFRPKEYSNALAEVARQIKEIRKIDSLALVLALDVSFADLRWASSRIKPPCGGCQIRLENRPTLCDCELGRQPRASAEEIPSARSFDPLRYSRRGEQIGLLRLLVGRCQVSLEPRMGRPEDYEKNNLIAQLCNAWQEATKKKVDKKNEKIIRFMTDFLALNGIDSLNVESRLAIYETRSAANFE